MMNRNFLSASIFPSDSQAGPVDEEVAFLLPYNESFFLLEFP